MAPFATAAAETPSRSAGAPATRPSTSVSQGEGRTANDEVALHRALLRLEQGDARGAQRNLDTLASRRPGDRGIAALRDLSNQQVRADESRRLAANVGIGYEHSSSLIILGRPIGQVGDNTQFEGLTFDLQADLTVHRTEDMRVAVRTVDFLTGIHPTGDEFSDLDDLEHVGSYDVGPEVDFVVSPQEHVTLSYDLQYVTIPPDTHWGGTRNALTASYTRVVPGFGVTSASYQFAKEDYSNFFNESRAVSINSEGDGLYSTDGLAHVFSLTQTFELPRFFATARRGPEVEVGIGYERQATRQAIYQADLYGVSLVLRTPLTRDLVFDFGGRFVYSEFDERPDQFSARRRDHEAGVFGGVTQTLSPNLAIRVESEYFRHTSNADGPDSADPFEYDNCTVGVRLLYFY